MMETLEDAYAEGRKDERVAIVEMLMDLHQQTDQGGWALHYARLIEQMDIQKDTNAKP